MRTFYSSEQVTDVYSHELDIRRKNIFQFRHKLLPELMNEQISDVKVQGHVDLTTYAFGSNSEFRCFLLKYISNRTFHSRNTFLTIFTFGQLFDETNPLYPLISSKL